MIFAVMCGETGLDANNDRPATKGLLDGFPGFMPGAMFAHDVIPDIDNNVYRSIIRKWQSSNRNNHK